MKTASRTPEGVPGNCPICNAVLCLEPSDPVGDAPCPYCGHLLWFVRLANQVKYYPQEDIAATKRQRLYEAIANWARDAGIDLRAIHNLDSFDLAQLFLELERSLGVTITSAQARNLRTLGDVIDHLVRDD
jgi:acyl carrier protein